MKRGQTQLSFGMIFSIILIITFLAFGFYGIKTFLDLQNDIKVSQFISDLQEDINDVWKSSQSADEIEYNLPKKTSHLCFADDDYENMELRDKNELYLAGAIISKIDINKIVGNEEEKCFETKDGKIILVLEKVYGETLVNIK